MKKTYRLGIVGAGWVAREIWLPRLMATGRFTITLIEDVDASACEAVRARYPMPHYGAEPDLVLIATPNVLHAAQALHHLERGRHVWVDKPVCLNLRDLENLTSASRASGAKLLTPQAALHRSDVRQMEAALREHDIGAPTLVELSWIRGSGIPRTAWATDKAMAGAGSTIDLGWHLLEVGYSLLDWPETTRVASLAGNSYVASTEQRTADWHGNEAVAFCVSNVEDTAVVLIKTPKAGIKMETAWASQEAVDRTRIVLNGPRGKLELETTFGFSRQRVAASTLTLTRAGKADRLALRHSEVGEEYNLAVGSLLEQIDGDTNCDENYRRLRSMVCAVQSMIDSIELR